MSDLAYAAIVFCALAIVIGLVVPIGYVIWADIIRTRVRRD